MKKDLEYLVLSDIHLGNKRNRTHEIIKNLNIYFDHFSHHSQFKDLDLIFIAGDLFDRLLDFSSADIHESAIWLIRLMKFCIRNHIKLRVLEGTPSHDWRQSKIIDTLLDSFNDKGDIRYIDSLYIEHIADYDLTVLYVPDEWSSSSELTFNQVKQLLSDNRLDAVDIAIMHGTFAYQCQHVPEHISHKEYDYLNIVRYFINIGHFHSFSNHERIIAQGSFDRLSHNEEEPKGGVVCHISVDNTNNHFTFIENTHAKIFKTLIVRDLDLDKALKKLYKQLDTIPDNSYVSIKAKKDHPIYASIDKLKSDYPMLYINRKSLDEDDHQVAVSNIVNPSYVTITITPDNIIDLLMQEVTSKYDLDMQKQGMLKTILGELND